MPHSVVAEIRRPQRWRYLVRSASRPTLTLPPQYWRPELGARFEAAATESHVAVDCPRILTMEVGRNDPCPCGSGKKFKRCCGAPRTDPLELAAGAVRAIQDAAEMKVVRLIRAELGDDAFGNAWDEFGVAMADLEPDHDEQNLFVPWVLYDWEPWEGARHVLRPRSVRLTPAACSVAGRGATLSSAESDFLLSVLMAPTSFHDVVASEPGRTTTLRERATTPSRRRPTIGS